MAFSARLNFATQATIADPATISLADVGEYFTSDNVEAALQSTGAQLAQKANAVQEEWSNLSLINGWTFGVGGYLKIRKNAFGMVTCVGFFIKPPAVIVNFQAISLFPLGYRSFVSFAITSINGSNAAQRKFYYSSSSHQILIPTDSLIVNTDSISMSFNFTT